MRVAGTRPALARRLMDWGRDVRELLVVLVIACLVEVSLRRSTLPATTERLGIALDTTGGSEAMSRVAASPMLAVTARRQVRAVQLVVGRWPFGDTCLRRCLVLGQRLRRFDPVLVIGVRRTAPDGFAAHSWLVVGGQSLDPTSRLFMALRGRP
jgi:Transglutaminase-like superfamily